MDNLSLLIYTWVSLLQMLAKSLHLIQYYKNETILIDAMQNFLSHLIL